MNKKAVITIIILVLLVLGLGGYLAYDKIYLQYFNEESARTMINDVSVDVNELFEAGGILDKLDRAYGDSNSTYFGYIYSLDKRYSKISELDINPLLYAAMYDNMVCNGTAQKMPETLVKSNLNKMFGSQVKYKGSTVTAGTSYIFNYDDATKSYTYTIPYAVNPYAPTYKAANVSTTVEEGKVIVTRRAFYVEFENSGTGTEYTRAIIYKSQDKKNKLLTLQLKNGVLNTDEVLAKTGSKMTTYIYTFTEESEGYKLYSVERK